VETEEAFGETTLVVDSARIVDACLHLRDELGFNMLADLTAADYLGWGGRGVAGYIGTASGRDLNKPMTQGLQQLPQTKPRRFAVSYHLVRVASGAREAPRVRVRAWLDEGDEIATVIPVWPAADWFERELWDMFGIPVSGHPNLKRLLMDDDWEGHPLRKDYPLGGEPVRFSGEE
jgi:NADH-quinone oxidoreductase subunit C